MLTQLFLKVAFVGAEWVLWLLLILNFISIAVITERILYFRRTKVFIEVLTEKLSGFLRSRDLQGAYNLVADSEAIECGVVAAGLLALHRGTTACAEAMLGAKARMKGALDSVVNELLNRDTLYEPMRTLRDEYPPWLEANWDKIP